MQTKGNFIIRFCEKIRTAISYTHRTKQISQSVRIAVVLISLTFGGSSIAFTDVVLPRVDVIGQSIDRPQTLVRVSTNPIFPKSVQFDLKDEKIVGIVFEYSEDSISYLSIKSEMQNILGVRPQIADNVTTAWRIEKKACAVMVTRDEEDKTIRIIIRSVVK